MISAIEKIRKANVSISSSKINEKENWLDDLFDLSTIEPYQVIIIDNFDKFLKVCNEDTIMVKKTIQEYSKKYHTMIILFTNNETLKYTFPR